MSDNLHPTDVQVGANLRTLRGERTQDAIALAMRERGWKWSQATQWSVETGERPVRVAEALDLLAILELEPDRIADLVASDAAGQVRIAERRAAEATTRLHDAAQQHAEAHTALAEARAVSEQSESIEDGAP